MAVVDDSSFHKDLTEHQSNTGYASTTLLQEARKLSLDDSVKRTGRNRAENLSADSLGDDDDESTHNVLYDQLLYPYRGPLRRDELGRTLSSRSLQDRSVGSISGAPNRPGSVDDDNRSWSTGSSVHSRSGTGVDADEKSWQKRDSMHSRNSAAAPTGFVLDGMGDGMDSTGSIDTFGGDEDSDGDEELMLGKKAFQELEQSSTRPSLFKSHSLRMPKKTIGGGLSLIDEKSSLD